MAATTNAEGYPPKSVHRTHLTTDGQTMVVSSGANLLVQTGGLVDARGAVRRAVTVHTSNSAEITNDGIKVLTSTENIKMRIAAPFTGSHVKIVMASSNPVTDNAVISFIVTTKLGKGRFHSSGRTITFSTYPQTVKGKWVELIGTTNIRARRSWWIAGAGPGSSNANISYTITTSTA